MNCDQVFVILTRGPFPSGEATDAAVEIHLSFCEECRHFADALRPDGSTDSETLVPEESRGLPYYWGVAATSGGEHGTSVKTVKGHRTRRKRKTTFFERHEPLAHLSGWQLAFAVLMGATLGTLLRVLGYADGSEPAQNAAAQVVPAVASANSYQPLPSRASQELAAKLGATPACWEDQLPGLENRLREDGHSMSALARHEELCCTKCHNASSPRFALRATTAKIVRSCQVCHPDGNVPQMEARGGF